MLARLVFVLLLAGCAADTGIIPANRFIDRDLEATRRGDSRDVQDMRAFDPGAPPFSHDSNTFARF